MEFKLKTAASAMAEEQVTEKCTAEAVGSGTLPVYATPAMTALMEKAAVKASQNQLPDGYTTVGMSMDIAHVAPTPLGARVRAEAELLSQDRKTLLFKVTAWDDNGLIGKGTHKRYIVSEEHFLKKAQGKLQG